MVGGRALAVLLLLLGNAARTWAETAGSGAVPSSTRPAGGEADNEEMIRNLDFYYYLDVLDTEAMLSVIVSGAPPELAVPTGAKRYAKPVVNEPSKEIPDGGAQKTKP
jgi:hypothetical protein